MNPIRTLVLTLAMLAAGAAAQSGTVYFYPPDDGKWIAGRSYISSGTAASAIALTIEPTKCGWYKADFSGSGVSQFWLGKPGTDRIGPNGRWSTDFEPTDNFNDVGGVFRLAEIFTRLNSTKIYLVADELDPTDPTAGWYGIDPGYNDDSRCKFELAAFIYDTDASVHPDFSCGIWSMGASEGNGTDTKGPCAEGPAAYSGANGNLKPTCTGVVKGLVKPNLNSTTRKIEYSGNDSKKCWTNAEWFDKAFKSTPGVNVEHCYNMPFTQIKTGTAVGSFEFDSDKMQNANGRLVGGFYPELLNSAPADATCPTCNTKRTADRFPPRIAAVTKEIFDEYQSKEGDFNDGDHPPRSAFGITQEPTAAIYDWGARPETATAAGGATWAAWYLHGNTAMKTAYKSPTAEYDAAAKANEHFCFESHADFYYDPAQVFYFSGDDDIWVYINNKLVIDLGGNHMAAPGNVKLNTLGLTEGELYPIDIFFCDKRTVNSNVRITTNMYVVQKSNFYADPKETRTDNYMCVLATGGADCASKMGVGGASGNFCGPQLISSGYTVDFYMVRRGTTDTLWLSQKPPASKGERGDCNGTGNTFTCYGGIKVTEAVYSCGGRTQCKGNADATGKVKNLSGNFNVYARLMSNGTQVAGSKPLLIDNFKTETNTRLVWGNLNSEDDKVKTTLTDADGGATSQEQKVIAGKRTPIYIAEGSWSDPGTYTAFVYDNDPETAGGKAYSVTVTGATGLSIYGSKTGTDIKTSGILPSTGIDTLWVEGDYRGGNKKFFLNVTSENESAPSLELTVYQPTLRFTKNDFSNQVNPTGYTEWSTEIPYVGTPLEIYVAAWDPVKNKLCDHCDFILTETSTATKPGARPDIVIADGTTRITNGKLSTYIRGTEAIGATDTYTASWKVTGPSPEVNNAEWTLLKFKDAPVPMPMKSYISDRNGDGIGDIVKIEYNKSFNGRGDSLLPVLLEVTWDIDDETHYFHLDGHTVENLKNYNYVDNLYKDAGFFARNRAYWQQFVNDSTITIATTKFSKDILTFAKDKDGKKPSVSSWTPFKDPEKCQGGSGNCPLQYSSNPAFLLDSISPIVIKAEYLREGGGDCNNKENACQERLTIRLSEPVFAASSEVAQFDFKNPFSYCFGRSQNVSTCPLDNITEEQRQSQTWDEVNNWGWEQVSGEGDPNAASTVTYKPGGKINTMNSAGSGEGHNIVEVVYHAYKTDPSGETTTRMPKPGDWVRIFAGKNAFADAGGNKANQKERGVIITGTKPSDKKQIRIGEITANPSDPVLGGIFEPGGDLPAWFDRGILDNIGRGKSNELFKNGVAEFLPVPDNITDIQEIKRNYPGSVGTLFEVDVGNVSKEITDNCDAGKKCYLVNPDGSASTETVSMGNNIAKAITLHASAYYHTNLGDYTAHRNPIEAKCSDAIFGDNCYDKKYNFYLAWDLKTNAGRFVGAGAYVAISKFYWQLDYFTDDGISGNLRRVSSQKDKQEFIEMFGVKRAAAKKGAAPPPAE